MVILICVCSPVLRDVNTYRKKGRGFHVVFFRGSAAASVLILRAREKHPTPENEKERDPLSAIHRNPTYLSPEQSRKILYSHL